jgi:DNA-binding transcriptional MerR regulator
MKINEVEAAVGVTKKNIRFYEEEGLITPGREPGNGYRSYSQTDVERLRRIKLLRKLDVPLAEIREMLEGQSTLAEGMNRQLERLSTRRKDLEEAIGLHAAPAGARQPGTTGCGADACAPDRTGRTGGDLCEH